MTKEENNIPARTSPEWSNYVLSHFVSDELMDGKPIVAGLRRVTKLLLGPIIKSVPVQVFPSQLPGGIGRSTVSYEVTIKDSETGEYIVYGDVADVTEDNTETLFALHGSATAATRAEARALRKALGLRVVAAEEIVTSRDIAADYTQKAAATLKVEAKTDGSFKGESPATDAQRKAIQTMCKKVGVNINNDNVVQVVEEVSLEVVGSAFTKLTKETASSLITQLQEMQSGKRELANGLIK